MAKILFVCDAGCNRSPTFARWFEKNAPNYEVRSAGLYWGYPDQVNKEVLEWANIIAVMTLKQKKTIHEKYPEVIDRVRVIGIEDVYDPDELALIELIEYWAKEEGAWL
jgi:predicted protein tyrosine phosphatase